MNTEAPTRKTYNEMQAAYDFFNTALFDGELPDCLITLQRKNRARGYYSPERFTSRDGEVTDEIAMNPATFASRTPSDVLSTLVHEMVHLWQQHFGTPSRTAYHNREWAAKMKEVGLQPSDTGAPGGKETGQRMTHYVVDNGPFADACAELLETGEFVTWCETIFAPKETKGKNGKRTKYTCDGCGLNVWAKDGARIACGDCEMALEVAA